MRSFRVMSVVILAMCLILGSAMAATIEVNIETDQADFNPADGICDADAEMIGEQCSLRAAVQTANLLPGPDTVIIPPGFAIELELTGSGGASAGDLDIEEDLEILGFVGDPPLDSADLPILDASALGDRHFDVLEGVSLTIRGIQFINGSSTDAGGAIRAANGAELVVDWSSFSENEAVGGGAISAGSGMLSITDSDFLANAAAGSGFASFGSALRVVGAGTALATVSIERSSFRDNHGDAGRQIFLAGIQGTLDNVTVDGQDWVELPGLDACYGIQFTGGDLLIRNSTLTRHDDTSTACSDLLIRNLGETDRLRVAHSVVYSNDASCRLENSEDGEISFFQSMIGESPDCEPYFDQVSVDAPELMELAQDSGRLSYSRSAIDLYSNVVDAGLEANATPDDPELACLASDQRGLSRPVDGDADLVARCDYGAVERSEPLSWIVNSFSTDAEDVAPGDGLCDFNPFAPGSQCSLRAAVMEANAFPGVQIIRFAPSDEPALLTIPADDGTIEAAHGDLDISEAVSIQGSMGPDGTPTRILQLVNDRIFDLAVGEGSQVYLRDLILEGGRTAGSGGGLRVADGQVWVSSSRFIGNGAEEAGGAIHVGAGQVHLQDVDLTDNEAEVRGSAVAVDSSAQLIVVQSSIRNHSSTDAGGMPVSAVWSDADAEITVINSSIFDNSRGLRLELPARLVLRHNTITDNGAEGVVALLSANTELVFDANILEQTVSGAQDCQFTDLMGAQVQSYEYNLSSDDSCTLTTDTSFMADPLLGLPSPVPSTLTFALRPSYGSPGQSPSPALDRMPLDLCEPVDQSGQPRPIDLTDVVDVDGLCDLGALEVRWGDSLFSDRFGGF